MNSLTTSILVCIFTLLLTGCGLSTTIEDRPLSPDDTQSRAYPSAYPSAYPMNEAITQGNKGVSHPEQLISAQVLLVAASGQTIRGDTLITSENIDSYRPSAETVQRVSHYFKANGFEVTPLVGISLTISASAQHFSDVFQVSSAVSLANDNDAVGDVQAKADSNAPHLELPLDSLETAIADSIVSVTFVPSPDFGPTNFSF